MMNKYRTTPGTGRGERRCRIPQSAAGADRRGPGRCCRGYCLSSDPGYPLRRWPGCTLAALGIPAVLGYAKIAGMPLVTGLYTMLLPMAAYAVLGSSRHLVVAADSATAVILAAALTGLAAVGSERYVRLAGLAALLTAGMLLAARLARLSFLANFLSRTVLVGFLAGVGIQVAVSQLPAMLGVTAAGEETLPKLVDTVRVLPHVRWADVALSIMVLVVVVVARWVSRRTGRRIPGLLIAVIIAIIGSWACGSGQPWRGRGRARPTRAAQPGAARPRLARRQGAAGCRVVDVRGHHGPERRHLPGLRRQVRGAVQRGHRSGRPERRQRCRRVLRHVRGQRQPDQNPDSGQRWRPQPAVPAHRLRRGPARAGAAHRAAGLPARRRPGRGGLRDRHRAHRPPRDAAHPGPPETRVRRGPAHDGRGGGSGGRVRHRARHHRLDHRAPAAQLPARSTASW